MNEASTFLNYMPAFSQVGSLAFVLVAVGFGLFLSLCINMGPSFINLLQTSIHRGFRPAAWFAFGVVVNDASVICLCILTSIQVVMTTHNELLMFIIAAGVLLFLFGLSTFKREVKEPVPNESVELESSSENDIPRWYVFFAKGFVLNLLNPFAWLFWFSTVAIVSGNMGGNKLATLIFFAIVLGCCLAMECLKAYGAAFFKRFFNPRRVKVLNRVLGLLLMAFGVYFVFVKGLIPMIW
ncbi:MAG: LysE family transporter [Bacteroidales bacterium]|nr:LysE family transporter [Bacteroidales bacterium]